MKIKILSGILLISGVSFFTSCHGDLNVIQPSQFTSLSMWTEESDATSAVNGAYTQFRSAFSDLLNIYGEMRSNWYESGAVNDAFFNRVGTNVLLSGDAGTNWSSIYTTINSANLILKHTPEISFTNEATRSEVMANAYFLRAYCYFTLVRVFGVCPLLTCGFESEKQEDMYPCRTAASEVYAQVESDLKDAVNALPAATFYNNSNRITKYAAAMVLTSVYMQQGKYADAASAVKTVIDSPHALATNDDLALGSAYNKIRTTDGLAESIYSYEYNATISNGGWWPTYAFNSAATAIFGTYSIFERTYGPTNQFLNVYAANDLRIQPNQFFHWNYTNPDNGKTWTAPENACGCWFWYDEDALLNTGRSTKDRDIFRYAEALLDAAESIAQSQGVTAEAAGYLAQVKARANMEGKTVAAITADLQKLGKQAFIEECWTERLREFPMEFKIWDDCLRTGKFPVISSTEKGKVTYVDLVGAKNASGATFKSSDLLWPISLNEMQRNPSLTQNEGYAVQ